jgi:hypothetical protein
MTKRMVDKNSMRGGAGLSAVVLLLAFIFQGAVAPWVVSALAVVLGIGSLFGLRYSPLGAAYRAAKRSFRLSIPIEPEEEPPPRFAQTLGFVVLALASLSFLADADPLGWTLTLIVAGLQGLLAATGLCVGCEIYTYTRRFAAKGA